MSIVVAIIVFGALVFFHELGHFLLAKKNGVGVIEFSIGMGPRLFSFDKGGTKYSLKALPIGGSCAMLGEDSDSNDEEAFGNKSVWARISVVIAGPIFNFILAFLMAIVIISIVGYDPPVIKDVMEGYPAEEAGILPGDVIVKMNDQKITVYRDVSLYIALHQGEDVDLEILRDGEIVKTTISPKLSEEGYYYMGIITYNERVKTSPLGILKYSFYEVKFQISTTIKSLGMLFGGKVSVNELSGPVGIVNMVGEVVEGSTSEEADTATNVFNVFLNVMNFSILLSANLGVMNLLPLPALDGGRLVFLVIEIVRGKPINKEKEGMVHFVGLMLLMVLMVFVLFNDVRKLF
ncbi:MAG: RIP metalloprotease RseP [Clostridiales bacterium]|nr:RIP metalloprotease RseP [Clostridiales bacterium]